jgi:hypothetical protein
MWINNYIGDSFSCEMLKKIVQNDSGNFLYVYRYYRYRHIRLNKDVLNVGFKPDYADDMSALHAGTRQWSHIIEHRRHAEVSSARCKVTLTLPLLPLIFVYHSKAAYLRGESQRRNPTIYLMAATSMLDNFMRSIAIYRQQNLMIL